MSASGARGGLRADVPAAGGMRRHLHAAGRPARGPDAAGLRLRGDGHQLRAAAPQRAIAGSLARLSSPRALVVRDGQGTADRGPRTGVGDIVLLAEGDRVPADMLLVEASNLAVDESLLTGESAPVIKVCAPRLRSSGRARARRRRATSRCAFSGTLVTRGTARGRVVATGERSALGRIGKSLAGIAVESTPIQRETQRVVEVGGHRRLGAGGRRWPSPMRSCSATGCTACWPG